MEKLKCGVVGWLLSGTSEIRRKGAPFERKKRVNKSNLERERKEKEKKIFICDDPVSRLLSYPSVSPISASYFFVYQFCV